MCIGNKHVDLFAFLSFKNIPSICKCMIYDVGYVFMMMNVLRANGKYRYPVIQHIRVGFPNGCGY